MTFASEFVRPRSISVRKRAINVTPDEQCTRAFKTRRCEELRYKVFSGVRGLCKQDFPTGIFRTGINEQKGPETTVERNNKTEIYALRSGGRGRDRAAYGTYYTCARACVYGVARFYDGSAVPFLSVHKMVTPRKFNNLYFHIRGFPLRP